jgi:tetratricopeptide (TPR) repeat protein
MGSFTDRFIDWAAKLKSSLGSTDDADPALRDFNQAVRLKPNDAEAYYNRGTAYSQLGKYPEAAQDFEKAIQLKPDYLAAYLGRGLARAKLGDHTAAVRDFDRAILLQPDEAKASTSTDRPSATPTALSSCERT